MIQVNLSEAKTHFSKYARLVKQGKTVILCERNVPFAEIRPVRSARNRRRFGLSKGLIGIGPEFFEADTDIGKVANEGPVFPER
jgi:antitoxin (DNA-binding transcriptional repressor) of toxin-antitoxin stability system